MVLHLNFSHSCLVYCVHIISFGEKFTYLDQIEALFHNLQSYF